MARHSGDKTTKDLAMVKSLKALQRIDMQKKAQAIEADAGGKIPGLRQALQEAKAGHFAAVHTPEQMAARSPTHPTGAVKSDAGIAKRSR